MDALTDAIISLLELYVLFMAVSLLVAGCVRLQKFWFMRRTRQFVDKQERQWLTEQQQRRQHQRTVRGGESGLR